MSTDTDLKPCPFCGSAQPNPHTDDCYFVVLADLKAAAGADLSGAPAVLAAWNRRAALAAPAAAPEPVPPRDERSVFEAHERKQGRPEAALYRTPAGHYEDADVERAWRTWQGLVRLGLMPAAPTA